MINGNSLLKCSGVDIVKNRPHQLLAAFASRALEGDRRFSIIHHLMNYKTRYIRAIQEREVSERWWRRGNIGRVIKMNKEYFDI